MSNNSERFYDIAQARNYLTDSLVRYKKELVYVGNIGRISDPDSKNFLVSIKPTTSVYEMTINMDDPDLDLKPLRLGFLPSLNDDVGPAPYCMRIPARAYKIGLCADNSQFVLPPVKGAVPLNKNTLLFSKEFAKMVKGEYMPFKEARDIFTKLSARTKETAVVAFSRDFAVNLDSIFYRINGEPVAKINSHGNPKLVKGFEYLQQLMDKAAA